MKIWKMIKKINKRVKKSNRKMNQRRIEMKNKRLSKILPNNIKNKKTKREIIKHKIHILKEKENS